MLCKSIYLNDQNSSSGREIKVVFFVPKIGKKVKLNCHLENIHTSRSILQPDTLKLLSYLPWDILIIVDNFIFLKHLNRNGLETRLATFDNHHYFQPFSLLN